MKSNKYQLYSPCHDRGSRTHDLPQSIRACYQLNHRWCFKMKNWTNSRYRVSCLSNFLFIKTYLKNTHSHTHTHIYTLYIKSMKYQDKNVITISAHWQIKTKQDQRRRTLQNHCNGFICNSIFLTMAFKPFHHLQPIISLVHFLLAEEKNVRNDNVIMYYIHFHRIQIW